MVQWPDSSGSSDVRLQTGVGDRRLAVLGWVDSHSGPSPEPGPHVAIRGVPQTGGPPTSLVIHLEQVPALVAALTEVSYRLAAKWQEEGLGRIF